jgi:hypothetical protein
MSIERDKMIKRWLLAALSIAMFTTSASALDVKASKTTTASPTEAWAAVGDFCGIARWHPEVEKCELSEVMGAKLRRMTLKKGGTVREQLVEQNNEAMLQKSLFLDGTLPVTNYQATLKVEATSEGTTYIWSGKFEADGVSDAQAIEAVSDFYSAGLDALVNPAK